MVKSALAEGCRECKRSGIVYLGEDQVGKDFDVVPVTVESSE